MNPDDLRSRLKEAGRPVATSLDPIPAVRRRATSIRRKKRITAAIACVGVMACATLAVGTSGIHRSLHGYEDGVTAPRTPAQVDETDLMKAALPLPPQSFNFRTVRHLVHGRGEVSASEVSGMLYDIGHAGLAHVTYRCSGASPDNPVQIVVSLSGESGAAVRSTRKSCTETTATVILAVEPPLDRGELAVRVTKAEADQRLLAAQIAGYGFSTPR